jgi:hypothetical protein
MSGLNENSSLFQRLHGLHRSERNPESAVFGFEEVDVRTNEGYAAFLEEPKKTRFRRLNSSGRMASV